MDFTRIKLENFRNYSNAEVFLKDSPFWIFRGNNSAGKSTLACDALTYALFGKIAAMEDPRDSKINIDDIIKRGTVSSIVEIDFDHRGDSFRIIRKRRKTKSTSTENVSIMKNSKWMVDGGTKTEGDKWINKNLWNYEDFTKTTLILQNEMTNALDLKRSDRRDYLEKLFGIKDFENMALISRERAKDLGNDLRVDRARLEEKNDRKIKVSVLKADEAKLKKTVKLSEEKLSKESNKEKDLKNIVDTTNDIILELSTLLKSETQLKESIIETETSMKLNSEGIKKQQNILKDKTIIEKSLQNVEKLEKQISEIEDSKKELDEVENQKKKILIRIEQKKKKIEDEIETISNQIISRDEDFKKQTKKIQDLQEDKIELIRLTKVIATQESVEKELSECKANKEKQNRLIQESNEIKKELEVKIENKTKEMDTVREEISILPEQEKLLKLKVKAKNSIQGKEADLKSFEEKISKTNKEISEMITEIKLKEKDKTNLEVKNQSLDNEMKEFENLADQVDCPKCKQKLSDGHVKIILGDLLKNQNINIIEIKKLTDQVIDLNETHKNHSDLGSELKKNESKINEEISLLREEQDGIKQVEKIISRLNTKKIVYDTFETSGGINGQFLNLKQQIVDLKKDINAIIYDEKKFNNLDKARDEIIGAIKIEKEVAKRIESIPSEEGILNKIGKDIEKIQADKKQNEKELNEKSYEKEYSDDFKRIELSIYKLSKQTSVETQIKKELTELNPNETRNKVKALFHANDELQRLNGQLEKIQENLDKQNKELSDITFKYKDKKFEKINEKLIQAEDELEKQNKIVDEFQKIVTISEVELQSHQQEMVEQSNLRKEIEKIDDKLSEKQGESDDYFVLENIFKKISGRILSRLRNQINLATSHTLNMLGNPQLQGLKLENDFTLTVDTPDGEEKLGFFSGGQKVRLGFAFRLALSQVLADFKGNELETLIIDEGGFGALDTEGQEGIVEVFNALEDQFKRVIVISHIPQIANKLPGQSLLIDKGKIIK